GAKWSRDVPYALLGQLRNIAQPGRLVGAENTVGDRLRIADGLLQHLASEDARPGVIVLEDIHLADPESLQVFSLLGRGLLDTRVSLLVAFDPNTTAEVDQDFVRLLMDPGSIQSEIGDFGREDALALACEYGIHDIGNHGAAALVADSGGRLRAAQEILSSL